MCLLHIAVQANGVQSERMTPRHTDTSYICVIRPQGMLSGTISIPGSRVRALGR